MERQIVRRRGNFTYDEIEEDCGVVPIHYSNEIYDQYENNKAFNTYEGDENPSKLTERRKFLEKHQWECVRCNETSFAKSVNSCFNCGGHMVKFKSQVKFKSYPDK